MSKNGSIPILDTQNAATVEGREKGAKACPQGVARRKLADISNMPQKSQLLIPGEKLQPIPTTTKEYIDQLQTDNMALLKLLGQRNKIIEQSGIELDRLRVNLLKMQEQNHQLALQNTHMLVELNSGKDRLKALQHELGCKNALLQSRKREIEEEKTRKKTCKNIDNKDDDKSQNTEESLQIKGLSSSEQVLSKDDAETKRPLKRRQSARINAAELKPAEDSCKMDDAKSHACPLSNNPVPQKESTSANPSVKNEETEFSSDCRQESHGTGRSSLSRPSRVAAKKVQSYKEIPINVKMRRSE